MKLAFNYTKKYQKYKKYEVLFFLIFCIVPIIHPPTFLPELLNYTTRFILVFYNIFNVYDFITCFKKPYLTIDGENIKVSFPQSTTLFKKFTFGDIKEVNFVENKSTRTFLKRVQPMHESSYLAVHLKNGKTRYIIFFQLSEEDQQKVIEVFKEKGLLKE